MKRSTFLGTVSVFFTIFFVSYFVYAESNPVPYRISGSIGSQLDPKMTANAEILNRFITSIQSEGWQVDVTWSHAIVHKVYSKIAGEKISDIVVEKTKGCKSFDENCLSYIKNLNRRLDATLDSYAGEVLIPTQENRFSLSVEAGRNYREEKIGSLTKAFMSKKLDAYSRIIEPISFARISQVCFGDCIDLYQLTIE